MAEPPQEDAVEPDPAHSGRSRRRRQRDRPTPQTVRSGDMVWFRYTTRQWMRGRVISFGRRRLRFEVMGGELARTAPLSWEDAHWHQRKGA